MKKRLTNESALQILEHEGYTPESLMLTGYQGYFVPLDIWRELVGRFNTGFKRGTRVKLNSISTRKVTRVSNVHEANQMARSMGIGNGNEYVLDIMKRENIPVYRYPRKIEVGNKFATNIVHAIQKSKYHRSKDHKIITGNWYGSEKNKLNSFKTAKELKEYLDKCPSWRKPLSDPRPEYFIQTVTLDGGGVLHGTKEPYGYVHQVYVHFNYNWESKRESRLHVKFEHGAQALMTSDWVKKCHSTELYERDENVPLVCDTRYKCSKSDGCFHSGPHKRAINCDMTSCTVHHDVSCVPIAKSNENNMNIVHKGTTHPPPVRLDTEEIDAYYEEILRQDLRRQYEMGVRDDIAPMFNHTFYKHINDLVDLAGGRLT